MSYAGWYQWGKPLQPVLKTLVCSGRGSNSRPPAHEEEALTTRPPRRSQIFIVQNFCRVFHKNGRSNACLLELLFYSFVDLILVFFFFHRRLLLPQIMIILTRVILLTGIHPFFRSLSLSLSLSISLF